MRAPHKKGNTTMKKIKMNDHFVDYKNDTILCGKTFLKNASKYGTPEYEDFVGIRRDYPEFKIVVVEPKKAEAKMTMKGLTREFMEVHIVKLYGEKSKEHEEFQNQKRMSEGYTNPYMYMRKWFVKQYPNWDGKEEKRKEVRARKAAAKIERAKENIVKIEEAATAKKKEA